MTLALLWLACALPADVKDGPASVEAEATGPSLYALPVPLVTHEAERTTLAAFQGAPVVVSMFYTTCPSACPLLVEAARSALVEAGDPAVTVLLGSLDPENDSVEALRRAHESRGVGGQFVFARPEPDQVREVAALLGIKVRPLPGGGFAHTSVLVLLDAEGRVLARAEGNEGREALVAALRAL